MAYFFVSYEYFVDGQIKATGDAQFDVPRMTEDRLSIIRQKLAAQNGCLPDQIIFRCVSKLDDS